MNDPIIDRVRLERVCMGNPDMAGPLLELLVEEATPIVASLPELVAQQDAVAVRSQAHAVKGIAANVGAARLQAAAAALEASAIAAAPWNEMEAQSSGLATALTELRAEVERGL